MLDRKNVWTGCTWMPKCNLSKVTTIRVVMLLLSQHWLISDGIPTDFRLISKQTKLFLITRSIWKNCRGFPRNQPHWNLLQRNAILRKEYIKQLLRWRSQNLKEKNATGGVLPFQWVATFNVFYIFPRKCKIKTGWSVSLIIRLI